MGFHRVQVKHRHKRYEQAKGSLSGRCKTPRVQCSFDLEVFLRIGAEAEQRNLPFGAIIREKVAKAYLMEDMMTLTEARRE